MKVKKEAFKLFHGGTRALAQIEANGVKIDRKYLKRAMRQVEQEIAEAEDKLRQGEVYEIWKHEFRDKLNFGATDQLAHVFYGCMGYKPTAFTEKAKKPKMDESAMERIDHPFAHDWIDWRKLEKVYTTYLKGVQREMVDGFIHTDYMLHTVRSYRGSAANPNFQNFPVRNKKLAGIVRPMFIPRGEDRVIVETDFSGIEVRVSACYNQDPVLIEYICDKTKDMHRDMAAQIYMVDPDDVSKDMRYCGKNQFVFPEFYGSYYVDCARNLWDAISRMDLEVGLIPMGGWLEDRGIRERGACDPDYKPVPGTFEYHVKEVEDDFWNNRFCVYTQWKKRWWQEYLRTGGFPTHTGFYIEGIMKRNDVLNYPIQSAAFHCLLKCLIRIQNWLTKNAMRSLLIGQIHDSLIADVHISELGEYLAFARDTMTEWLPRKWKWISVPLEVEAEVSPPERSWHEKRVVPIQFDSSREEWKQEALKSAKAAKMDWRNYQEFLRSINYPIPSIN